ncbi:pheromone-regulated protein prm10 [Rhodotorula kratochvilovae]
MAPLPPPVPPPRPPSPPSRDPASAVQTPATPLTPADTPPPLPLDGAAPPAAHLPAPSKPRRNVAWNEQVSEHVAIPFYSEEAPDGESAGDGHGDAALRGRRGSVGRRGSAQEGASSGGSDPFSDRYRLDDVPISLAGGQDDGALDGMVAPVVRQLEVWVDPLERDGLPDLAAVDGGAEGAHKASEDKAQGLVTAYAQGARGLWQGLSQRRASIVAMREKEEDEGEKDRRTEDELNSPDADAVPRLPGGTPGILGALIALQQQEAALARRGSASVSSSALPTPAPSAPSSPTLHPLSTATSSADLLDEDSSDDEVERERFIARLRAKRASKNALHVASSSVASASKHAAGAALRFATGKGERGRTSAPSSRPQSVSDRRAPPSPSLSAHHRSRSATSLVQLKGGDTSPTEQKSGLAQHHRSHSHNTLSRLISHTSVSRLSHTSLSPPGSPASPTSPTIPVGMAVPHKAKLTSEFTKRVRKVGDRLGLEWETERTRPNAARSSAGVFGGLVLGATALAAPATPSGTSVAPLPTRPGYNLSRYSAPDIHHAVRSTSPTPPRTQPPSPVLPPSRRTLSPPPSARPSPPGTIKPSPTPSRKSLSEMVREEEEKDLQEQTAQASEPTLRERRRHGRKAVFSLQVNDIPSATEEEHEPTSASSRPTLTIDTSASTRSNSPSPTSASGTFRFLGPRTPKSAPGSGALSPTMTPAERERDRAERKAREEAEREARERERDLREWQKEKRRRRKAREKELKRRRVFIKEHVAAILERQQFILKLARAFMMFGAPSHRLEAQIQATARVLELPHCTALYLPGVILVNFGEPATCTSDIKFLKQAAGLDLGKLKATYWVYNKVIRDKVSVADGSAQLDDLMTSPPKYGLLKNVVVGGLAGAFIMPSAFGGSFIDCLAAIPLGGLLVVVQVLLSRNDMYSSLFEIVIACINAVIAAALSRTNQLCFYSVAAGSIVLILPGFIVLCAALELANRSIVSGAVRLTYAALYALFLGFGLSLGAEIYTKGGREQIIGGGDYTCAYLRSDAPWWRQTVPRWYYFLTIPMFLLCMALKNGQPLFRRDTVAMVAIGCAGFSANFFSGWEFKNMPALTSFLGSFVVGVLGNAWSKITRDSAFHVMVVGIFVQLPSGLANGGLLRFAADSATTNANAFGTAIDAAAGLIRIAVGMTVGLFLAAAVMNLLSRRGRRRGAHLSTF